MIGQAEVKCGTRGILRKIALGVAFACLILSTVMARGAESPGSGGLKIFAGSPKLIVVNGYSTSFKWPELLKQKIDRFTAGRPRIEVQSATAGGTPVAGWMDVDTGEPRKVWTDKLRPALAGKGERIAIVLAQQSLQGCFGNRREGIRNGEDIQRIQQGADILARYAELLKQDGADLILIAMHIYKHPMEPEIGNERLALKKLLERNIPGVFPGPDVWGPTRHLYPMAFAGDSVHPGPAGVEVMAQLWFEALLRHDSLEVPDWSREKVREIRAQRRNSMKPDCDKTSVGLLPLIDLGAELYQGEQGGLYPGGKNLAPGAHLKAGLELAQKIVPLNRQGEQDPENGKLVLLSIGMSNTTMEFREFIKIADLESRKNPQLVIVDGAFGGQSADRISTEAAPYWARVEQRLEEAGVSNSQVRVAWIKQATPLPERAFPKEPRSLQNHLRRIVHILKGRYPNLSLIYLSSRIYGGYASTPLNPEPHAYETAFAVKWLVEEQLGGGMELNFDPLRGEVKSPWLAWGPYLWADGLQPRSDGLIWECEDFAPDGTHPADRARQKVAKALLHFFTTDKIAREWFLAE